MPKSTGRRTAVKLPWKHQEKHGKRQKRYDDHKDSTGQRTITGKGNTL